MSLYCAYKNGNWFGNKKIYETGEQTAKQKKTEEFNQLREELMKKYLKSQQSLTVSELTRPMKTKKKKIKIVKEENEKPDEL